MSCLHIALVSFTLGLGLQFLLVLIGPRFKGADQRRTERFHFPKWTTLDRLKKLIPPKDKEE